MTKLNNDAKKEVLPEGLSLLHLLPPDHIYIQRQLDDGKINTVLYYRLAIAHQNAGLSSQRNESDAVNVILSIYLHILASTVHPPVTLVRNIPATHSMLWTCQSRVIRNNTVNVSNCFSEAVLSD